MNRIRLADLGFSDLLDVAHHLMIEDRVVHTTVQVSDDKVDLYHRARIKDEVEKELDGAAVPDISMAGADPETWGTSPEQQAAIAQAMAQFGPQAGG